MTKAIQAIQANQITKSYGSRKVLQGLNLDLEPGERAVIVGPSGIGKSTLLRIIAGLEGPDEGSINLFGECVSTSKWILEPHRRRLGFVFQSPALWPHMTVADNIRFGLQKMEKFEADRRLKDVLEETGLEKLAGRYPSNLSGGEARRVALARSIAPYPCSILMDEPLSNLDSDSREQLLEFILRITEQNHITILYVTHDPVEARTISDRILHMKGGVLNRQDELEQN
ncbi:MAG: Fe(3+) ions import ATP-binding protein FbpC [Candidatus Dichloromethanomonas elyunquensis]|nr:MAG: Fe(3+) ions import ATP-binding protein FbpC [Candidatus Dichloromethanomonas elyunquensis]